MAFSSASSSPSRMKVREVRTLFSSAVRQPETTGRAPAVKLIMAGTFSAQCRARKPTRPGRELGIMKPTRFLSAKRTGQRAPEGLGFGQHGPVGQGMALLILGYDVGTTEYPHRIGKGLHDAAVDPGG